MKQGHSKPAVHRNAADDDRLEEDWPDEDWADSEPEYGIACGPHDPLLLIAIATVQDEALRVETARRALADPVRDAVQTALGARVRYRARTKENPVAVFLNTE